jgi:beta-lactam-binding protein with PASTA domain
MKSLFRKIFCLPVFIHLLAVMALSLIAIYATLRYIDAYTNHNQAVLIPDIRGFQMEEAIPVLEQNFLRYEVIDSIYSKEFNPGAIVELSPEVNAKVKKNRIIYITVNAKTEKTAQIPEVTDLSYRQAYADLKSRGFRYVEKKLVPGEFYDLTVGVEYEGKLVNSGTRVPLTANLFLVVCDGTVGPEENKINDEETTESAGSDEHWF